METVPVHVKGLPRQSNRKKQCTLRQRFYWQFVNLMNMYNWHQFDIKQWYQGWYSYCRQWCNILSITITTCNSWAHIVQDFIIISTTMFRYTSSGRQVSVNLQFQGELTLNLRVWQFSKFISIVFRGSIQLVNGICSLLIYQEYMTQFILVFFKFSWWLQVATFFIQFCVFLLSKNCHSDLFSLPV